MRQGHEGHSKRLFMVAALALVVGACSGTNATAAPPTGGNGNTGAPATGGQNGGSGVAGAITNLSGVRSYKFTETLAGGTFGSLLSSFGGSGTDNAPFTVTGTVVTQPDTAADITMAGFHIVEVGGYDYIDIGSGEFTKAPVNGSGLAEGFSPQVLLSGTIDASTASGYAKVGSELKNGVQADHYQASTSALAEYGSIMGVTGATWSADVWLAQTGGYPVSVAIIAKASDNSVAFEMAFDLTDINSPSNSVTAPTNVIGA